jgi:hypothetical protein
MRRSSLRGLRLVSPKSKEQWFANMRTMHGQAIDLLARRTHSLDRGADMLDACVLIVDATSQLTSHFDL